MKEQPITIETRPLYRTLARVALPIALQSLIASSLNLVDSLMVGSLGEAELAAVGLSSQLFFLHWGVMFGFASGSAAFFAQFWGTQDMANIKRVLGFAVAFSFGVGFLFFVPAMFFPESVLRIFTDIPEAIVLGKGYVRIASISFLTVSITIPCTAALRATQQTKLPLFISMFVFSSNTLLNYLLIFGKLGLPAMGVNGAATATMISRGIELILILYVIFGRKNIIAGKLKEYFHWNRMLAARVMRSALPVTVNETMWSLGMVTYNAFYGRMGITEFASVQASMTINTLFIMAIFSLGDALLILVGQRIGMGQFDYAFELTKRLLRIGVFVGIGSGILLILTAKPIIGLFNFSPDGQRYAIYILVIYGAMMWLKLYNGLNIIGTFRCGGDTKYAMFLEVGSVWLIGVPLVYIGVFYLDIPVYFVVLMAQAEEIVKGFFCRSRFRSKKWINSLIQGID
ncbi:MAG: MATE family efflux transporter [Firmicutes bacterium HGW-Firmicutes-11]|nr:MAG: MATE family efflux transporter [Firmicutes bacterium HGW-Firmicutes-11]